MAIRVGLEPLTSGSGVRGVNHQATAPPHPSRRVWMWGSAIYNLPSQISALIIMLLTKKQRWHKLSSQTSKQFSIQSALFFVFILSINFLVSKLWIFKVYILVGLGNFGPTSAQQTLFLNSGSICAFLIFDISKYQLQ